MTGSDVHRNGKFLHAADLSVKAAALIPWIDERAAEAAAAATLPGDVIDVLVAQGFFRLALPRSLGGLELDPVATLVATETLAWGDGSTAWAVAIGNSSFIFAWLDQAVAAKLLAGRAGQPVASMLAPSGDGVEVPGGYRLSGRWHYVTGSPHASLFVVGFAVIGPDGEVQHTSGGPAFRWAVLDAADVRIETTWLGAAGMRGSGTHDITAQDVFVPNAQTLAPFVGPPRVEGRLYRMPFFMGTAMLTGIPLGVARRALDELNTLCRRKTREGMLLAEDPDMQVRLAEAEASLRASRSFVLESLERIWKVVQVCDAPLDRRIDFALAAQHAMRSAVNAVNVAFEVGGASAAKADSVIQRCWRDVNVMSQHVSFHRARFREAGQALLGVVDEVPDF
ncbi:acyl-CoA dehydrogenase family protein [Mycobacterium montefiorense]|uniref:acyl-CoA dehydrogenase family protein n=1 Tax=Mycobacterium montefiorense TaxID=154654 RepID=UPI0021F34F24|nr:acyl-CoA dehydrogenase family protein [Mycobacterium montefiorense]MCV7426965.1 acyl-CoA dehydrogenase family protein [Mycobacterium montefiorense]